jgi:hypothetical protein
MSQRFPRESTAHWKNTNSTFRNNQYEDPHSEALYIASDAAFGLIQGNIFVNNGSTSHIFFTWCNDQGGSENLCAAYGQGNGAPHDWAGRDNTFLDTWRAYYAVSIRDELVGRADPAHLRGRPPARHGADHRPTRA